MRHLIICLAVILVLVLSFSVLGVSEDECVAGGGEWTAPIISQGDDPVSKIVQPFCKCDTGFYWNDDAKSCESDQELRCKQTGGTWLNNECQCPEGTIKWTEGFGCDMPGPEPKASEDKESSPNLRTESGSDEKGTSYELLLLISLFVLLFIIGIIVYYYFIKSKRKKRREEDEDQ